jgi:hypothetical protein
LRPASKMRIFGSGTPRLYRDLGYALFFWYLRARIRGGGRAVHRAKRLENVGVAALRLYYASTRRATPYARAGRAPVALRRTPAHFACKRCPL